MRRFFPVFIILVIISLFCGVAVRTLGADNTGACFEMNDPAGDEHGYGSYQYPTNIAFTPYKGLFDILHFKVTTVQDGQVFFDTTFGKVTNPWAAPEGFIHQNLRIYIDTITEQGLTDPVKKGANVRFNPKYAWDICLKIVGWGNSQLITVENGKLVEHPLNTVLLNDQQTIRAVVPENIIGSPNKHWHYYVMAGSYDGFGEDFFRKVMQKSGEWVIGGGLDQNIEPQVMDILALVKGSHDQVKQLRSFDQAAGTLAELYPVGLDLSEFNFWVWFAGFMIFILLSALIYISIVKPRKLAKIVWFRVKQKEETV